MKPVDEPVFFFSGWNELLAVVAVPEFEVPAPGTALRIGRKPLFTSASAEPAFPIGRNPASELSEIVPAAGFFIPLDVIPAGLRLVRAAGAVTGGLAAAGEASAGKMDGG